MRQLDIAFGSSRLEKTYRGETWPWEKLVDRLRTTKRTAETVEEYKSMPKAKQDAIKDVGAFIGGRLEGGARTKVLSRSMVCLDIDHGTREVLSTFELAFPDAPAFMYSTHKHREGAERLRMVIPLGRDVDPEEYGAISRKIAESLDMELFDDTTYQPQRIMYWPSTSKDGEFLAMEAAGEEFLDPDELLAEYEDWTDRKEWPTSSREAKIGRRSADKAEDPREKEGYIGAFCRIYGIHEAIETFVPEYEKSALEGRYTYAPGSTANGVVIYEDLWSYSNHETDPAGLRLCNAFDLVRIHKFGKLDLGAKEGIRIDRLPSYNAMLEFAGKDEEVARELNRSEAGAFEVEDGDAPEAEDWMEKLDRSKRGDVLKTYKNLETILEHHPVFKGKFGRDEFAGKDIAKGDLPWRKVRGYQPLSDLDDSQLRAWLEKHYSITGKDKIFDSLRNHCHRHGFHPVKDYLEGLEWDGEERIERLFIDYFAVPDEEYTRAVSRKFMLAAIKRIYEPGCKFDTMLTLMGAQGTGKSSFFARLGKNWFTDSIKDIRNKDALEGLQGKWIIEIGEMAALKKADAENIKGFLSAQTDSFRVAYGRRTQDYPRSCVFVATTNEWGFLRDKTGNRRFWVLGAVKGEKPSKNVFELTSKEIDQLWAEAKALYDSKSESVFLSRELEARAAEIQESFMQEDPRTSDIREFLDRKLPANWKDLDAFERLAWLDSEEEGTEERTKTCVLEVAELALKMSRRPDQYEAREIASIILSFPDWDRGSTVRIAGYGIQKGFKKINLTKQLGFTFLEEKKV